MIGTKLINKKVLLRVSYIVLVGLIYAILMLTNFGTMDFEAGLRDKRTITLTFLIIGCSFVIMLIMSAYSKVKRMSDENIVRDESILKSYRLKLQSDGLYDEFTTIYVPQRNKERKLEYYRDYLELQRDKKRWWLSADGQQQKIDYYTNLFKATLEENFDINSIQFKVKKYTASLFFAKYSGKDGKGSAFYSGWEGFIGKAAPVIILSLTGMMLSFSFYLNMGQPTMEQWKNMVLILCISLSYLVTGLSFGNYSVETVYASVLETRKTEVRTFLERKGIKSEVFMEIEKPEIKVDLSKNEEKKQ